MASGFLYGEKIAGSEQYRVFFVTNWHVIDGLRRSMQSPNRVFSDGTPAESVKPITRFNPSAGQNAQQLGLDLNTDAWFEDKEADVAVSPINIETLKSLGINNVSFFENDKFVADRSKLKELGAAEGDGVFVLGFPVLGKETEMLAAQNFVIVRRGTIARIRDCLEGARQNFLIDSFVFPGNSGGPVLNEPQMVAIQGTRPIGTAYLIGMVSAYLPYDEVAISPQTQKPRVVFEENSGLALVIPMDVIRKVVKSALDHTAPPSK